MPSELHATRTQAVTTAQPLRIKLEEDAVRKMAFGRGLGSPSRAGVPLPVCNLARTRVILARGRLITNMDLQDGRWPVLNGVRTYADNQ